MEGGGEPEAVVELDRRNILRKVLPGVMPTSISTLTGETPPLPSCCNVCDVNKAEREEWERERGVGGSRWRLSLVETPVLKEGAGVGCREREQCEGSATAEDRGQGGRRKGGGRGRIPWYRRAHRLC